MDSGKDAHINTVIGYKSRQCSCLWILLLLGGLYIHLHISANHHKSTYARSGIGEITSFVFYALDPFDTADDAADTNTSYNSSNGNIVGGIIFLFWVFATFWIQVEDRGDHLLLTFGPCRWCLCGTGKEKIPYKNIRDYQISKSCFYGFGLPCCTSIKLFNSCSIGCCGKSGRCCAHKTVKLTIKERVQADEAEEGTDCCCEKLCFRCCCGERGRYIGKGCCFQPCCNPCDANCCMVNTLFISTNDPEGLMKLLDSKVGQGKGPDEQAVIDTLI